MLKYQSNSFSSLLFKRKFINPRSFIFFVMFLSFLVTVPRTVINASTNNFNEPSLKFINHKWERVNVEVRRGNEDSCDKNAAFETKQILKEETWIIPAPGVDVCYRRDLDPNHSNGQWTDWRRITVNTENQNESIR